MSQEEQPQGKWRQRRASSSSPPKSRWDSPPLQNVSTMSSPTRTSAGSPVSCPICLGTPENKSFSDTCFHEFCFTCLLEWSKIKSECPLCKQPFTRIIHSVRSMDQYEEYQVPEEQPETGESMDDWLYYALNPYVRSAMLNRDPRRRHAIARRFRHFHYQDFVIPRDPRPPRPHRPRPHATGDFRRQVYEDHMWSQLLPDVTGTFREATPRFFRENPAMTHRLVPWLNRELSILVVHSGDPQQIQRLIDMILELIKSHSILSPAFRRHVEPHVGTRAKHFQHEFYTFARSPYDVTGYDQHVHFEHRHEQEDSSDSGSEIEVLEELSPSRSSSARTHISNDILGYIPTTSRSEALERVARFLANNVTSPEPGPSGRGDSSNVAGQTTPSCRWDSSSDSDVEVVAILRPKQERTPVLIDINSDEETPVSVPTSPVDPNPRKSKNGERLKRLMRQQLNGAGSSSSLTVGESSGSSRRRIQSSVSSDESSAKKFRKRSYRKADYDSSDSEFEPNRKMKSPRPLKISSRDEISRGSSSDEEKKKKKRRKRSRDERSDRKKSGKHKKHKRKKSKERDSKRKKSKSHRRCDDTSSSSSSRGSAKSSSSSLRSWHE